MQFLNALTPLQWLLAAAVPVGVVALYFLKLRRRPVLVPSTYLWHKSIEDLHVNSLFQRLRRNLLLLLQLLILAAALLALARPAWLAAERGGQRHIILIDNSASMAATDVKPSRLEWAKQQARTQIIDHLAGTDVAMIIAFNDTARVVCSPSSNRRLLRQRLASIKQSQRPTNIRDALNVAAGRANPLKYVDLPAGSDESDLTHLHVFSDGRFPDVKHFSLGNLEPHYYPVGKADLNVAIAAMSLRRNDQNPNKLDVFARLHNYSARPLPVLSSLYLNGELKDAEQVELEPGEDHPVVFSVENVPAGTFHLRLQTSDLLAADNEGWCVLGRPRQAKVLLVSPGNRWLELALDTEAARQIAALDQITPDRMETDDYRRKALSGYYDLIIYDGVAPPTMPQSNTLFFGAVPKLPSLGQVRKLTNPVIVSVNQSHPLMRFVNMEEVAVVESLLPRLPAGTEMLVESGDGPLLFLLARQAFTDCIVGFGLVRQTPEGRRLNSTWFAQYSFPMFIFNALRILGNVADELGGKPVLPGQAVVLRSQSPTQELVVRDPGGRRYDLKRTPQGTFLFSHTDRRGVYTVSTAGRHSAEPDNSAAPPAEQRFAVNLFDAQESNIQPRQEFQVGYNPVKATGGGSRVRREAWPALLLAALIVLLLEWYIYNKRVYI